VSEKKQLSKEELKKISGGGGFDKKPTVKQTGMRCISCEYILLWNGDHTGKIFDCPNCGKHTFMGVDPYY